MPQPSNTLFRSHGTFKVRSVTFYVRITFIHFAGLGSQYLTYWGASLGPGNSLYLLWRQWHNFYAGFIIFWNLFELALMFLPIVYLIYMVVLRDKSSGAVRWERLSRLLAVDRIFSVCTIGIFVSFNMFTALQLIHVGFYTLYGTRKTMNVYPRVLPNLA
jgi:hypothetical protein